VPFQFDEPDLAPGDRERLGLDDRFTFLFTFDFLSVVRRKNPVGLLEAYRRAFPEPGPQRLVLKSINGDLFPRDRERILDAAAERDDVELWDRYVDAADRLALVALADCYVSLHRSEGLGLTMAEAMAMGTPVIASRYSGNLDFMDDASALLIGGEEVLIGPGNYYPAEGHWFDPDLDEAAAAMRRLRGDPDLAGSLVVEARARIAERSPQRVGAAIVDRLRHLWLERR
jgi:glycosyltransferase involved in cell wall biosynthesis